MNPAHTEPQAQGLELSLADMQRIATAAATGRLDKEILNHKEPGKLVARVPAGGTTAILKLWDRSSLKSRLRAALRNDSLSREWFAFRRLHARGVAVPRPIGQCQVSRRETGFTHALFLEDLGKCRMLGYELRDLMLAGDEHRMRALEDLAISLVRDLLGAGLVDVDRSIYNFVLAANGKVYILDFELARRVWLPGLASQACAQMLARLIVTYTFTVQPQTDRARAFALRLAEATRPSSSLLKRVRLLVEASLEEQRRQVGVRTESFLPW